MARTSRSLKKRIEILLIIVKNELLFVFYAIGFLIHVLL